MSYKLFLDDIRDPEICVKYMHRRIGARNPVYLQEWITVRSYEEFVVVIKDIGMPATISFDHDLSLEHYEHGEQERAYEEQTGYDCAKWLVEYCREQGAPLPECFVHSMNPVGTKNIQDCLNKYIWASSKPAI